MLLLRVRENMYNSISSSAVWGLGCIGVLHTAFIDDALYLLTGFLASSAAACKILNVKI